MSAIVLAAIATGFAEELRLLEPPNDAPQAPFGWGTDVWCDTDLDPSRDVDGFSPIALAQALMRRLDCPRGGLIDDPNYGFDLRGELNRGMTRVELDAIGGRVKSELTKDDRVSSVRVVVSAGADARSLVVVIQVRPLDPRLGNFSMTLAVTSAALVLEAMAA